MHSSSITFVILTKNECRNIAACLASLPTGAQALVYDAESDDGTARRARELGAEVAVAPWRGFAQARLDAAARVLTPWTFMLDADERVSEALRAEIEALEPPDGISAYSVPRRNFLCGRWIRGAGWWPDRLVRLFRTGRASIASSAGSGDAAVHEVWVPNGAADDLRGSIDHDSYPSLADYRRKFHAYTDLEARAEEPSVLRALGAWLLAPLRALWLLLVRGAVLDGWQGAFVAVGSSLYRPVALTKALVRHG